ncbi:MAG: SRPBCC family protein, partial [Gammaproteobacteria bacterium]
MRALLIALLVLLAGFLGAGFLLPTQVLVERSIAIQRPPATIFTLLDGYHRFRDWSPWAALDPGANWVVSGPEHGVGARLEWSGDPTLVGSGTQEIVTSEPWNRIVTRVELDGQGISLATFEIHGDTLGSRLTWRFETDVTEGQDWLGAFLGRYFALFLDDWVGADQERGLKRIKALAESLPQGDFSRADIERVQVPGQDVLFAAGAVPDDPDTAARRLEQAFQEVSEAIRRRGLTVAGAPLAISRRAADGTLRFEAAIPVTGWGDGAASDGAVERGRSPSGDAVRIAHRGPYDSLPESYRLLEAWM